MGVLRTSAIAVIGLGAAAMAPGCGSDSSGGGTATGGTGNVGATGGSGAMGGSGATGGGGTGATGGSGATGGMAGTGGGGGCPGTLKDCSGTCTNTDFDPANCGGCGTACKTGEFCSQGKCAGQCLGTTLCTDKCVDTGTDPNNCGACGTACKTGEVCSVGVCGIKCAGGATKCGTECVDTQSNPNHCGGCGAACTGGQVCSAGQCATSCGTGYTKCGSACVDTGNDKNNCGACGTVCPSGQACLQGKCGSCDTNTTDCDGDGYAGKAEGDCCEVPGVCGANPQLVNPGALEVVGNGIDDNCNGLADLFDKSDTQDCDAALASDSSDPKDFAKALGVCRTTEEAPADKKSKTWGLIEAELLRADGSPIGDKRAHSIRQKFGDNITALEGKSMVVLSSGIAADKTQTNPGPNGGTTGSNVATAHTPSSNVNITTCTSPKCIKDWYGAANPPLKAANQFPLAPACGTASGGTANDSVMLRVRLRAPTNARSFSFNSYFFSSEYPEYVCSTFNDQFITLVDTPSGTPQPIPNPVDKNLTTYIDLSTGTKWPVGINIAKGTNLFAVCDPKVSVTGSPCYEADVNPKSCSLGVTDLAGTGWEPGTGANACPGGGGTYWLTVAGNVIPGQIVEVRFAIFDVGDTTLDSLALLDGFKWLPNATLPGTGG
ncbi:MAG: choice-of-anchor L domain-containing protein [Myxococcales bacterium]|nr:choice-of-anchor L domain-containing protein [Myxococcales bacterium]